MVIRAATNDDVSLLAALIRTSFRDVAERFNLTLDNCPTHPSSCTVEWIESALEKSVRYYLLEDKGKPCGCVALERARPEVCYLERLAVLPESRRMGFGKALVKHVLGEAERIGAKRVEIGVIAEHTELKDWYGRLGFSVKDTVHFDHLPFAVTFMFIEL